MPHPDEATGLHASIHRRLEALDHRHDRDVVRFAEAIRQRHRGRVAAVLLYGSYLRGKRDTLLDFYVLLDGLDGAMPPLQAWGNRCLPPNVYHLSLPPAGDRPGLRAKYATLTVSRFQRAMGDFHGYFWSRFTQPAGLVYARDDDTVRRVVAALAEATHHFAREVTPMLGERFPAERFWQRGLALTYASELRAEDPAGSADLYQHARGHFDSLLAAYADEPHGVIEAEAGAYRPRRAGSRSWYRWRWLLRSLQGKLLSVLRLVKAAATFDDPLDYLLWKIERHSGIYITPTERQRRHPLVFAWPLLWRLYRRGAFR
jgi:hypothetical protein